MVCFALLSLARLEPEAEHKFQKQKSHRRVSDVNLLKPHVLLQKSMAAEETGCALLHRLCGAFCRP